VKKDHSWTAGNVETRRCAPVASWADWCHQTLPDHQSAKWQCQHAQHMFTYYDDNVPTHTSAAASSASAECGYKLLLHPPYLPDLAPSDLYLFPLLKGHLSGTYY